MSGHSSTHLYDAQSRNACNFRRFVIVCIFWYLFSFVRLGKLTLSYAAYINIYNSDSRFFFWGVPTSDQEDDCCKILCPMLAPEKNHSVHIHALEPHRQTNRVLCA